MDQEQGKFFEDEDQELQTEQPQEAQNNKPDEVNDMKYFLELLKHIRAAINAGKDVPFTRKKMVDVEQCMMILDDLEDNLPDAVQYGMQMYAEQERILGEAERKAMNRVTSAEMRANAALEKARDDAQEIITNAENEAHAMIEDAQERADHMVSENEIVTRAREEARSIKNEARVDAGEMRLKANHDAYELLTSVEDELADACNAIRRRRAELGDENE